jgi:hypothetical protein
LQNGTDSTLLLIVDATERPAPHHPEAEHAGRATAVSVEAALEDRAGLCLGADFKLGTIHATRIPQCCKMARGGRE